MALRKLELMSLKNQHCLSIGRESVQGEFVDFRHQRKFLAFFSTALTFLVTFWVKPKSDRKLVKYAKGYECQMIAKTVLQPMLTRNT